MKQNITKKKYSEFCRAIITSYGWVHFLIISISVGSLMAFLCNAIWKPQFHVSSKLGDTRILPNNQNLLSLEKLADFRHSMQKYSSKQDFRRKKYKNGFSVSDNLKDLTLYKVNITNRSFLRKLKGLPIISEFHSIKIRKPQGYVFRHKNESSERSKFFLKFPPNLVKHLNKRNFKKTGEILFSRKLIKNNVKNYSLNAMTKIGNHDIDLLTSSKIVGNKINQSENSHLKLDEEKVLSIYDETAKIDEIQQLKYLESAKKSTIPATKYQTKGITDYAFYEPSTVRHFEEEHNFENSTLLFTSDLDKNTNSTSSSLTASSQPESLQNSFLTYSSIATSLMTNSAETKMEYHEYTIAPSTEKSLVESTLEIKDSSITPTHLSNLAESTLEIKDSSIPPTHLKNLTESNVQYSSTLSSKSKMIVYVSSKNMTTGNKTKQNGATPKWLKLITRNFNAWIKCTEKNVSVLREEEESLDLETYISYDKISFNETFFSHPSLVSLATVAYVMKIILLVLFCLGILFLALIIIAFAKVKETHGFSYLKDHLTYSLISVFGSETEKTTTLTLISPTSSTSSLISLPTVLEEASRDPKENLVFRK